MRASSLVAFVSVLALATSALAQDDARDAGADEGQATEGSRWRPHWERFGAAGGVLIGVAEIAAFTVYFVEPVTSARWTDTLPGDLEVRDALRITDEGTRETVVQLSDALFVTMLVWPIAVDSLLLAGLVRGDWDVALQTVLIDLEVMSVAHMVTWLTSRLAGRVRPEAVQCTADGTCTGIGVGPVMSFVGGHSLMAYASAGLTCTHHLESPWIAGNVEAAASTCAGGLAMATAISFLRIAVDRHWASDVTIGSLMGAAIGFALPQVMHYARTPNRALTEAAREAGLSYLAITPGVEGDPRGLTIAGGF